MNIKAIQYSIVALFVFLFTVSMPLQSAHSAPPAVLKQGSQLKDLHDFPNSLMTLGFMTEDLSSYFDTNTLDALSVFQKEHEELNERKEADHKQTDLKNVNVNNDELNMLAKIIYAEARGETYLGQVAVGAVVMNRLASSSFPDTMKGVIEEPRAFTAVDDGQYKLIPDKKAFRAAIEAANGYDPTNGALYYFNPKTATSDWIFSRKQTLEIGRHTFAI